MRWCLSYLNILESVVHFEVEYDKFRGFEDLKRVVKLLK